MTSRGSESQWIESALRPAMLIAYVLPILLVGCASDPPLPEAVIPPEPILSNSGEFMCPYTQDEVLAEWVTKAINTEAFAKVGGAASGTAASFALGRIPLLGWLFGSWAGETIAREIAISAAGGWDYIKEESDISFNTAEDMAVWLYATKSGNEHFESATKAAFGVYPDLVDCWWGAIRDAHLKPEYIAQQEVK